MSDTRIGPGFNLAHLAMSSGGGQAGDGGGPDGGATAGPAKPSAASHAASSHHHPDDAVRHVVHMEHNVIHLAEESAHLYERARANPCEREIVFAMRQIGARREKLLAARARLEVLAEAGNPKAGQALRVTDAKLHEVDQQLGQLREFQKNLRSGAPRERAKARVRDTIDRLDGPPRHSPDFRVRQQRAKEVLDRAGRYAAQPQPAPGRLGRAASVAHRLASLRSVRAAGKVLGPLGTALDAYQGWRESPVDSTFWRARTAASYAVTGALVNRHPLGAVLNLASLGHLSDFYKRVALLGVAVEATAVRQITRPMDSTTPLDTVSDRMRRDEHGGLWGVLGRFGHRIVPDGPRPSADESTKGRTK